MFHAYFNLTPITMRFLCLILPIFLISSACDNPQKAQVRFKLQPTTGSQSFALNQSRTNPANESYQSSLLELILSEIEVQNSTGWHKIADFYYFNATTNATINATLATGHYTALRFRFGVAPAKNSAVPNTLDFRNMEWPTQLGGGYHYMKWEGTFLHNNQDEGFAFHVGPTNGTDYSFLITIDLHQNFEADITNDIVLKLNLHELLQSPNAIPFANLPATIMDNPAIQSKIRQNADDAFSL
jgi:hypothetical protein